MFASRRFAAMTSITPPENMALLNSQREKRPQSPHLTIYQPQVSDPHMILKPKQCFHLSSPLSHDLTQSYPPTMLKILAHTRCARANAPLSDHMDPVLRQSNHRSLPLLRTLRCIPPLPPPPNLPSHRFGEPHLLCTEYARLATWEFEDVVCVAFYVSYLEWDQASSLGYGLW